MNTVSSQTTDNPIKLEKLRAIFDIVDRKHSVEQDLRPLSLVQRWVRDEIAEVMAEVKKGDDVGRRDELGDLLYVTYAAKKWRTAGSQDELLQIFLSHPSFMKYFDELTVGDFEHTFSKFRGRNEYLFDEVFLEELARHESKTKRLDLIDKYWDIIKYKKQKGFHSGLYKAFLRKYDEIWPMFESDAKEEGRIVPVGYYDKLIRNTISCEYLREKLEQFGLIEPIRSEVLHSFTYHSLDIEPFVDAIEIFESKGLSPVDAFVSAGFVSRLPISLQNIHHSTLALTHLKGWDQKIARFVASQGQYEIFLFLSYAIENGANLTDSLDLICESRERNRDNSLEYYRSLRGFVERGSGKYVSLKQQGMNDRQILLKVESEVKKMITV